MSNNKGFTLVEMLVSLAVVAIVMTSVILVISGIINLNKAVSAKQNSLNEVQEKYNIFMSDHEIYKTSDSSYVEDGITYYLTKIYYDEKFKKESIEETTNFLDIKYYSFNNIDTLEIRVYIKNSVVNYGNGSSPFIRVVYQ